ncbi:MAG: DNA ligase D [Chitinophagaceae bacterium]
MKSVVWDKKNTPELKFRDMLQPMLATLVDKPFDDDDWLYEIKWDGYRAVGFMHEGEVHLKSRNDKLFNDKFYPIYNALQEWETNAVVDGEVVVLDEKGQPDFGALQNWRSETDGNLIYYVFDLVWYQGRDLSGLLLTERKKILEQIIPDDPRIEFSKGFETSGIKFFESAKELGLEGIIAKKKNSTYEIGERTKDWVKIKANKRQEVVIGGYTINEDTSKPFSALLVGVFEENKFIYTGKIGTGFNIKTQQELIKKFKPLIVKKTAFETEPDIEKPSRFKPNPPKAEVKWLKPMLICEVNYTEMTKDGVMRHPSFEGLREDKKAKEVILEKPSHINDVIADDYKMLPDMKKQIGKRKTLLNPKDESQVKKVNGNELKFTNLDKIYWPAEKITKRQMINYYYEAAPFILPYLKDRPMSLNRHPDGIKGFSFYQKDVTGKVPEWAETYLYHTDESTEDKHFLVAKDEASLLYMANIGCIEMNPWSSTIKKPDNPSWCIIDLDPDKNSFDQVIEAAQVTKEILDDMKVDSYCKTSGSTGLHIYIPLGAKYTYEQSKEFARIIVSLVHERLPDYTSLERTVAKRKGKMYLDFLQNHAQATIAAPYSLRPKPGATVSMPLHWEEVKKGLKMKDFTIKNAIERMKSEGDLFKAVLGKGINLKKILSEIK